VTLSASRSSLIRFGDIYEIKIIKKSYNGQPLRDTFYAFVVIWLNTSAGDVIDYFKKNFDDKGWNVSLAKEVKLGSLQSNNAREDSPKRRKQGRRDRDDFDNRRGMDRSQNRYMNYRGQDYDGYGRRDEYSRYRNVDRRGDDRDDGSAEYYDSRGNSGYYDESRYQVEKKVVEPEKRIPCSSMSLKDPEAFARLLLLPADVIQNVILQLANNNKQALVGNPC
jgi:hypothetical protein